MPLKMIALHMPGPSASKGSPEKAKAGEQVASVSGLALERSEERESIKDGTSCNDVRRKDSKLFYPCKSSSLVLIYPPNFSSSHTISLDPVSLPYLRATSSSVVMPTNASTPKKIG